MSAPNDYGVHSIGELEGKIERLKTDYENELNRLIVRQEKLKGLAEQAREYFSLADKGSLSPSENLKLNICRQSMINNNINGHEDFEHLNALQKETDKKIATLKNSFENCKQLYEVYADIAKTYNEISKGNYVSKLVEEERKKRVKSIECKR